MLKHAASAISQASRVRGARLISASAVSRKDLVQDLYLRELKAYKPPPQAKDAHVGAVKSYSAPSPPKPPAVPADLAAELSKYDAEEPDLAESVTTTVTSAEEGTSGGAKEFLAFLEQDLPKREAHH
ncbi:hypothetical protein SISNIDRAFT_483671 [Sistotremastrum niveocremeum HHB9708]|uniref:ATP synthase complex subunit H n=1 Tax=Sistotremastrum niveocremeum HHB9708 TaxID=1314777 RepID=A0A164WWW9_9AGAM|nr:hypothetical protein SISNIDRAFT_483671 [Sistotremastrum niveocremeum HHB9708]